MKRLRPLYSVLLSALLGLALPDHAIAGQSAYDFSFPALNSDRRIALSDYKGSVLLVVNTASECGFTEQYDGLQKLADRYKGRKFVVLGVPANDFGNQEPDGEDAIQHFCAMRFGVTFPMTGKVHVKGPEIDPFYAWAATQVSVLGTPKWNFHKYLIGPDGQLVDWFSSATQPDSARITAAIDKLLADELK